MFRADNYSPAVIVRRREMEVTNPTKKGKKLTHPAPLGPRIFADTAEMKFLKPLLEAGIINGVTTNPSLMKKAGAKSWSEAKKMMKDICAMFDPFPVSLELTELTFDKMVKQASELRKLGNNSVIKVPTGGYQAIDKNYDPHTGLKVLHALWEKDIKTNATLIFNSSQAFWAAQAGATYVSPFLGRLADYAYKNDKPELPSGNSLYYIQDHKAPMSAVNTEYVASGGARKDIGIRLIREIVEIFSNYDLKTEVLAASFRNFAQVSEALQAGADILTVPGDLLMMVADHPLSDAGMTSFVEDSKAFSS